MRALVSQWRGWFARELMRQTDMPPNVRPQKDSLPFLTQAFVPKVASFFLEEYSHIENRIDEGPLEAYWLTKVGFPATHKKNLLPYTRL